MNLRELRTLEIAIEELLQLEDILKGRVFASSGHKKVTLTKDELYLTISRIRQQVYKVWKEENEAWENEK